MALTNALTLAVSALALLSSPNRLVDQGMTDAMLVHPLPDSWPGYHGDYSGRRHSDLAQITPRNFHELSLAWAFQSEQPASIKASPLLVDGIIHLTAIDNVWAVDARTGHPIWRYTYPPNKGGTIGQRGVGQVMPQKRQTRPPARMFDRNSLNILASPTGFEPVLSP